MREFPSAGPAKRPTANRGASASDWRKYGGNADATQLPPADSGSASLKASSRSRRLHTRAEERIHRTPLRQRCMPTAEQTCREKRPPPMRRPRHPKRIVVRPGRNDSAFNMSVFKSSSVAAEWRSACCRPRHRCPKETNSPQLGPDPSFSQPLDRISLSEMFGWNLTVWLGNYRADPQCFRRRRLEPRRSSVSTLQTSESCA